ncbi:hypothetical protein Acy02nite_02310 [Actinoplanes cyaneus]|uniref:Uncharacterized protein n=1 Tax=Actinoplanes cyaneus TaxID=52696 RepID=A0A919II67_9ACTN|nr:hypothetical protein Acy02nite_02310 [Actinoplanes cyaneus]
MISHSVPGPPFRAAVVVRATVGAPVTSALGLGLLLSLGLGLGLGDGAGDGSSVPQPAVAVSSRATTTRHGRIS